jgi:PiT family inorganic phosphate transporter
MATHLGIPVSTTHVITGAVTGVGVARSASSVKWQVTLRIVWAWIFTIPMAALIAAVFYKFSLLFMR